MIGAGLDVPIVVRGLVGREQARIDGQLDAPALARLEVGLGEGAESLWRFPAGLPPIGRCDIDLRDALARALPAIANGESELDRAAGGLGRQVRQREAGVAEAMTEGPQRLVALRIVPLVANGGAFIVGDRRRRIAWRTEAGDQQMR